MLQHGQLKESSGTEQPAAGARGLDGRRVRRGRARRAVGNRCALNMVYMCIDECVYIYIYRERDVGIHRYIEMCISYTCVYMLYIYIVAGR